MKLFPKKRKSEGEPKTNALSKGIQAGYKRIQSGWANWMMRRTENFSLRTWLLLLILFVISTSTYSVYLAVSAIKWKGESAITIIPVKKPRHVTGTEETAKDALGVSEIEYRRIKKFRLYMDSLEQSPSGKILYDSITSHRPGLMDSVRFIENYYKQLKQE